MSAGQKLLEMVEELKASGQIVATQRPAPVACFPSQDSRDYAVATEEEIQKYLDAQKYR